MKNLPLALTILRIILGPIIFLLIVYFQAFMVAFYLFLIAALSDYYDGMLARKYNLQSKLGEILDPIGDKLLLLFSLFSLVLVFNNFYIGAISSLMLGREIWVSALRDYASSINNSTVTSVSFLAKIKTTFQFLAISLYIVGLALDNALIIFIAGFVLFVALLLSIKTALDYSIKIFKF